MLLAPSTTAARRSARRAGFTLLEVLVVVAILVILAGVGVVATTSYLEKARKNQAVLQCKSLANACEAYYLDPQSGGNYPDNLQQLVTPFGGAGSLLKNGPADLRTPWPNINPEYGYRMITRADGSTGPEIFTSAPDGSHINQYGINQNSQQ